MGMVSGSVRGLRVAGLMMALLICRISRAQEPPPRIFNDPSAQTAASSATAALSGHAAVEGIPLSQPAKTHLEARKSSYSLTVTTLSGWTHA